jgi:hypothetical protein
MILFRHFLSLPSYLCHLFWKTRSRCWWAAPWEEMIKNRVLSFDEEKKEKLVFFCYFNFVVLMFCMQIK